MEIVATIDVNFQITQYYTAQRAEVVEYGDCISAEVEHPESPGYELKPSDVNIYPTPPLRQDMTQGQLLSGVLQVRIHSFPSPRQVASPRLKNLVCPTIYP